MSHMCSSEFTLELSGYMGYLNGSQVSDVMISVLVLVFITMVQKQGE